MSGEADGKRALIYGGGTGLGLACAEALLEAGAAVFITGRRVDKLTAAREKMARAGRIGLSAGDFTDEADVARVTGAALEFLGGLDTLVVSSGRSAQSGRDPCANISDEFAAATAAIRSSVPCR